MRRAFAILPFVVLSLAAQAQNAASGSQPTPSHNPIVIPAGTQFSLIVVRPVRANAVGAGNALFLQTVFPVSVSGRMAVPAGSYVQGQIVSFTAPTSKVKRATFRIRFTQLIYANGYVLPLATDASGMDTMDITVQATRANDLLLDNGAQMELTLSAPLTVSLQKARAAIALSHAVKPGSLKSATSCMATPDIPGTPGTPDTVIPGTPDTVIPGGPGMPDTVIPGTPSTTVPGTPGTPDSPGTVCPAVPLVLSSAPVLPVQQTDATK